MKPLLFSFRGMGQLRSFGRGIDQFIRIPKKERRLNNYAPVLEDRVATTSMGELAPEVKWAFCSLSRVGILIRLSSRRSWFITRL